MQYSHRSPLSRQRSVGLRFAGDCSVSFHKGLIIAGVWFSRGLIFSSTGNIDGTVRSERFSGSSKSHMVYAGLYQKMMLWLEPAEYIGLSEDMKIAHREPGADVLLVFA
jgi:hypothetical protein